MTAHQSWSVETARAASPVTPLPAKPPLGDLGGHVAIDYTVVADIRDRLATRLAADGRRLQASDRRQLLQALAAEELGDWVAQEMDRGHEAPSPAVEDGIVAAVLDSMAGLGRLEPLLQRGDIEDIHFEGSEPTVLRLANGDLVPGPPIAASDEELVTLLQSIGARHGEGQSSREFSTATPILNVRLRDVGDLGARLAAEMDVVPRPTGTIRIHRHVDVTLDDLLDLGTLDQAMTMFLRACVLAGASICVTGSPGAGKTTLLRALANEIPWSNVIVTVEDDRELGTHLSNRHAVVKSYEQRLPNAEGVGGFSMGDALNQALRDSPTRLIVGEVRGPYVMHLLDAVTNGIAGAMCTLHTPTARGVFERVLINALKAHPAPSPELVLRSLSALDLVVHVTRNGNNERYVSEIVELGPVGDSGDPSATHVFAPARPGGPGVGVPGSLSPDLLARLSAANFDANWLLPEHSGFYREGRAS